MKKTILLMLLAVGAAFAVEAAEPRAAWMSGRYGVAVHWIYERYTGDAATVDGPVDAFDIDAFLRDFDATGADWLLFTVGQNTGGYASPNAQIERLCGSHHCAKRDLVGEIAAALHARGKRFMAYLPGDVLVPSIAAGTGYAQGMPERALFQTNWTGVIREWSERWGRNLDGWWFDGMFSARYPKGFDVELWASAARAGNPDRVIAFNVQAYGQRLDGTIAGVAPATVQDDYLSGEAWFLHNGRLLYDWIDRDFPRTWMPETAYVKDTACLHHVLFPIDGDWHAWSAWSSLGLETSIYDRHRNHFSETAMAALREKGEFPVPVYTADELARFVEAFTRVGGAATINVGIDAYGRLNDKSLTLFGAVRDTLRLDRWTCRATELDGSVETEGRGVWAYAGRVTEVNGVRFAKLAAGRAPCPNLALEMEANLTENAYVDDAAADGLSENVRALLGGGVYHDGRRDRVYSVTLTGLVPGKKYLVQVWLADFRPCGRVRGEVLDDTVRIRYRTENAPNGTTVIRRFVAASDHVTLTFAPVIGMWNGAFQVNAIQLRELGE